MAIPEFVAHLRSKVGTDMLFLPGVSAVVFNDADEVLLTKRSDNGSWSIVSGILDPGEQPAEGIVREVLEETGVHIEVRALAAVETGEVVVYHNGDIAQYLDTLFYCVAIAGTAHVADDESTEVGWFSPHDLPEPMLPVALRRLHHVTTLLATPGIGPYYRRS